MEKHDFSFHIIGVLGAICLYLLVEPHNVGFSPDSIAYLEMSENLSAGKGFVDNAGNIIHHWPPFFSIAIALTSYITGLGISESGIVLQPFLLYMSIVVFLFILKKLRLNRTLIHVSALFLLVSPLVGNFSWFLSEGLFYLFLLLSFYFILEWLEKKQRKYLLITGVFCGLLFLTRYAAVGFIGGYVLIVFVLNRKTPIRSIKDILALIAPLIFTIIPWFLYIYSFKENPAVRNFDIHLISTSKLLDLLKTVGFWFLGSPVARISFAILVICYFTFFFNGKRSLKELIRKFYKRFTKEFFSIFVLCFTYLGFLLISISFFDAITPLDNRILSPVFIFILILILLFLQVLYDIEDNFLLIATSCFLVFAFSSATFPSHQIQYLNGKGYTKEKWSRSETLREWERSNQKIPVFTNGTELVYIHLGKRLNLLPLKGRELEIEKLLKEVKGGKAEILYLKKIDWKNFLVGQERLLEDTTGLKIKFLEDGLIMRATSE